MKMDEKMHALLHEWQADVELPADFKRQVWQRIARRAEQRKTTGFAEWFASIWQEPGLPRYSPLWAVAALVLGFSFGYLQAGKSAMNAKSQGESQYVASINPFSSAHLMAKQ